MTASSNKSLLSSSSISMAILLMAVILLSSNMVSHVSAAVCTESVVVTGAAFESTSYRSCTSFTGSASLTINTNGAVPTFSDLTSIGGGLHINSAKVAWNFADKFPALQTVTNITVVSGTNLVTFSSTTLQSVNNLDVTLSSSASGLFRMSHASLTQMGRVSINCPRCTSVTLDALTTCQSVIVLGTKEASSNPSFSAPKLETVSGAIYLSALSSVSMPMLYTAGGLSFISISGTASVSIATSHSATPAVVGTLVLTLTGTKASGFVGVIPTSVLQFDGTVTNWDATFLSSIPMGSTISILNMWAPNFAKPLIPGPLGRISYVQSLNLAFLPWTDLKAVEHIQYQLTSTELAGTLLAIASMPTLQNATIIYVPAAIQLNSVYGLRIFSLPTAQSVNALAIGPGIYPELALIEMPMVESLEITFFVGVIAPNAVIRMPMLTQWTSTAAINIPSARELYWLMSYVDELQMGTKTAPSAISNLDWLEGLQSFGSLALYFSSSMKDLTPLCDVMRTGNSLTISAPGICCTAMAEVLSHAFNVPSFDVETALVHGSTCTDYCNSANAHFCNSSITVETVVESSSSSTGDDVSSSSSGLFVQAGNSDSDTLSQNEIIAIAVVVPIVVIAIAALIFMKCFGTSKPAAAANSAPRPAAELTAVRTDVAAPSGGAAVPPAVAIHH